MHYPKLENKKILIGLLISLVAVMLVVSFIRTKKEYLVKQSFIFMDTEVDFIVEARDLEKLKILVPTGMRLAKLLSFYKADSCVARLNQGEVIKKGNECYPILAEVISLSKKVCKDSKGAFDPGFRGKYSILDLKFDNEEINAPKGSEFDFSGIAKGYIVDKLINLAKKLSMHFIMINAGGDIRVYSTRHIPLKIEIKNPFDPARPIDRISITDYSIATSGDYERGRHIWNPHTHKPAVGFISSSAGNKSCAIADAWATALFVLGPGALGLAEGDDVAAMIAVFGSGGKIIKIENKLWKKLKH